MTHNAELVPVNFFVSHPLHQADVQKYAYDEPGLYALISIDESGPQWAAFGSTRLSVRQELDKILAGQAPREILDLVARGHVRFVNCVIRMWKEAEAAEAYLNHTLAPQFILREQPLPTEYQVDLKLHGNDPHRPTKIASAAVS